MKNIYLVGFMGTGKTVVGKELAKRLGLEFVDLDELIEQTEGVRIADIFRDKGEPYFRKVEKEIVSQISQKTGLVVGCGGGVVLDGQNMDNLKKSGVVICLKASPEIILSRTKGIRYRPLLNVKDPKQRIRDLLTKRGPFYDQADYQIDTSDKSIKQVTDKVLELIKKTKD